MLLRVIFFQASWYLGLWRREFFSVTLEELKQQAHEFGLEGEDRTKFLREDWRKIHDAKLEKERFEMEAE